MSNNKKYVSLARLSNFLDNIKAQYSKIGHKHPISDLTDYTVDTELSPISTNPVQNKVIDAEFESMVTAMNALEQYVDASVAEVKVEATNQDVVVLHEAQQNAKTYTDIVAKGKADASHNHDDRYYTETEIDNMIFITIDDIDAICGSNV